MKSRILPALLGSMSCLVQINAAVITPEDALNRAFSDAGAKIPQRTVAGSIDEYKLCGLHGFDNTYVFSRTDGGLIVLPADDRFAPVLAVVDGGTISDGLLPEGLKYMLNLYNAEIRGVKARESSGIRNEVADVSPLLTTTWGQGDPYNRQCPPIVDWDISGSWSTVPPTGCTATALAQIMNYHKWPAVCDDKYAGTKFEWDNMLDSYLDEDYNDSQADAVALLMKICGEAIDTRYKADESSAYANKAVRALGDYFCYEKSTLRTLHRDYMPLSDLYKALSDELQAKRPVLVSAISENEQGHSFVIDGCNSDRFFHINWGWDGISDGFYRLTALMHDEEPENAFNYGQEFFVGIQKRLPSQGDYSDNESCLYAAGDLSADNGHIRTVNNLPYLGYEDFANLSTDHSEFYIGYKSVTPSGAIAYHFNEDSDYFYSQKISPNSHSTIFYSAHINSRELEEGTRLYLMYKLTRDANETPKEIKFPLGAQNHWLVDGNGKLYIPSKSSDLILESVQISSEIPLCEEATLKLLLNNCDEDWYVGTITAEITNLSTNDKKSLGNMVCHISPGETGELSLTKVFEEKLGDYSMKFYDHRGKQIGDSVRFSIAAPVSPDVIALTTANFPDEGLLKILSEEHDLNKDGYLSPREKYYITRLELDKINYHPDIYSLDGVKLLDCLEYLDCDGQNVEKLDITGMNNLVRVSLNGNPVNEFVYGVNDRLEMLYLSEGYSLGELTLSGLPSLRDALLSDAGLSSLRIRECPMLEGLNVDNNSMDSLDIEGAYLLKSLVARNNNLKHLDVSDFAYLQSLYIENNQLAWLDLTNNQSLFTLRANGNKRGVYTVDGKFDMSKLETEGFDYYRSSRFMYMGENGREIDFTRTDQVPYTYRHNGPSKFDDITFTLHDLGEDPSLGIDDIAAGTFTLGENYTIYGINGVECRKGQFSSTDGASEIAGLLPGFYLLRTSTRTLKFAVKR